MPLELPSSLSPSKVSSFTECALAFRFSAIDRLPDPPTVATVRGTLVHAALERLMLLPPTDRSPTAAQQCLVEAWEAMATDPELVELALADDAATTLVGEASTLVEKYFALEDPTTVTPIGLELKLDVEIDGLRLRGIIDRLELDEDGELVVTDYKTGRAPSPNFEQQSLAGVHFYSFLCADVLGRRPKAIRLLYLRSGETITTTPSEQSVRFLTTRTKAVWKAVETACRTGDFRPRQSSLCGGCAFREWCPAFGGDPARAAVEAPLRYGSLAAA
jgi:putative RecB family exonuclease